VTLKFQYSSQSSLLKTNDKRLVCFLDMLLKYLKSFTYCNPEQGRNQLFISGGGKSHEISFDNIIVVIQPWNNFFANGHIY